MPVTVLDVIVLVVVLISAILAMVRGFVREVLSVASWVAAAAAAYFFYKSLLPLVEPYFDNKTIAVIVSAAVIFFVALIVASYITMKISDFVIDSRIGAIDRAFGFIFGAVRGVLLVAIAVLFLNWFAPDPPAWIADARSKPFLDDIGERIKDAMPEDLEARFNDFRGGGGADPDAAPDGAALPAENDPAYDQTERSGIDQLIENAPGN